MFNITLPAWSTTRGTLQAANHPSNTVIHEKNSITIDAERSLYDDYGR